MLFVAKSCGELSPPPFANAGSEITYSIAPAGQCTSTASYTCADGFMPGAGSYTYQCQPIILGYVPNSVITVGEWVFMPSSDEANPPDCIRKCEHFS